MDILGIPVPVADKQERRLTFGALDLWFRRRPGEWHFATFQSGACEDRPLALTVAPAPEHLVWERCITGDTGNALTFQPRLPDRALVVRPEMPVRLRPGQSTDFFVGIPLWVAVSEGEASPRDELVEFPSVRLSNTWFGSTEVGELSYSLRTHAHRSVDALTLREHRCICPLQVKNRSDEVLSFERICLRCQHLHLYGGAGRLWTNAVRLSYRGRQDWSRVAYGRNPPERSGATQVVALPRKRLGRGMDLRSFQVGGKAGGTM